MDRDGATWTAVDQFLATEGIDAATAELLQDPTRQRLSVLCYVQHTDRVLMLRRNKPPFAGFWTAPGGKLLPGEDPRTGIAREVMEETNLALHEPRLQLIASETGPEHYNWLLFFFRGAPLTEGVTDNLLQGARSMDEGLLDWLPVHGLPDERLPEVEKLLLPYVLEQQGVVEAAEAGPHFARIRFDEEHNVSAITVRRLPLLS